MKKLSITLLILLCAPLVKAQNIDKLINQFKGEAGVTIQNINANQLPEGTFHLVGADLNIDEVIILNAEECSVKVNKQLDKAIRGIKAKGEYSTLVKSNEDGEYAHIINRVSNGKMVELIILNIDEDNEYSIVWVKGKNLSLDELSMADL